MKIVLNIFLIDYGKNYNSTGCISQNGFFGKYENVVAKASKSVFKEVIWQAVET